MWFALILFLVGVGAFCTLLGLTGIVMLLCLYWQFQREEKQRQNQEYNGLKQSLLKHIQEPNNEQGQGAVV